MEFSKNYDYGFTGVQAQAMLGVVNIAKGNMGSELHTNEGSFSTDTVEGIGVVDSVGAGDAYAAMLAAGILRDWQPEEILQQASRFAARICEIKGAIPDSPSFYEPFKPLFRNG